MKKALTIILVLAIILIAAFWWLLIQGKAPKTSSGEFDLAAYRALVADSTGRAQEVRIEIIGADDTPGFAADSGNFSLRYMSVYTSFQILWPERSIVIGGAVDEATAQEIAVTGDGQFDAQAYDRLLTAMEQTEQIWLTHEHIDHVMALTRHPNPAAIAPRLRLTAAQLSALPQFAIDGKLAPAISNITPQKLKGPVLIAPGVVVDSTAGHTPGSLSIYVALENGEEYLFIGDILWNMVNLDTLRTRPRLMQYVVFDPNEDRKAVLRQVRELHDIRAANPSLHIVPSHDGGHLDKLIASGALIKEFKQH